MDKRKKVVLETRLIDGTEVVGKVCNLCLTWKPLISGFHKKKDSYTARCKECRCKETREYKEANREQVLKQRRSYSELNKEKIAKKDEEYYKKNKEKILERQRIYEKVNRKIISARQRNWRQRNPDKVKLKHLRRRARKNSLPNSLNKEQRQKILTHFKNRCVLTGSEVDVQFDHVIPLATGHGGTIYENTIPLRSDLNISKSDSNIFKWFQANKQYYELSQERFDELIEYLADINNMTIDEYRGYVYWCHDNPTELSLSEDDHDAM